MTEFVIGRVKASLNKQFYTMNDSWLTDCIEFYMNDHENPTQDEIITFVMNQWVLYDLREINNENGCLPKNLANQKCITLPGKYILQMDKMYDISTSKYKQLEKIRNVSSENVEATENENATQEDKFQAWEPKPKRILQLFLTDGVQDILAIEYKPIRFLKDNLYPGFKLMIKGPVTCRKGVILLEETNIAEVGGEVDSLLIVNAVENVFARALNLEENPDPYNDNRKAAQENQISENASNALQIEDDFDVDFDAIDQIEKQIDQSSNSSKNTAVITVTRNEQRPINNVNNMQESNVNVTNKIQSSMVPAARNQQSSSQSSSNSYHTTVTKESCKNDTKNKIINFDDDDDSFLDMVDEKAFENLPSSKPAFVVQQKSITSKLASLQKKCNQSSESEFPMEDELNELSEMESEFFSKTKQIEPPKVKSYMHSEPSCSNSEMSNRKDSCTNEKSNQKDTASINKSKENSNTDSKNKNPSRKAPSVSESAFEPKPSTSYANDFPDNDYDLNDFDLETEEFDDYFYKNENIKTEKDIKTSSQTSTNSLKLQNSNSKEEPLHYQSSLKNSSTETKFGRHNSFDNFETEIAQDFDIEFEAKMDVDYKLFNNEHKFNITEKPKIEKINKPIINQSENKANENVMESTGVKRLASSISPHKNVSQKVRCLQSTPKTDKSSKHRKMTEFLNKPNLLCEVFPKMCELLCDVLKRPLKEEGSRILVRGKVINIIKLNLLKGEKGSYFHLEGTITDDTACLDIVFSTEVLEEIIGYNPQEFSQKRRQSKHDPKIKEQLREDLNKAQHTLRMMDDLMEIIIKKDARALVVNTMPLSKEQRRGMQKRVQQIKSEKL